MTFLLFDAAAKAAQFLCMLQSLRIKNLALLDEVALEFDSGFTVVTGETGAGKSILLGALSLLAGERADKSIIRQGAAACEVEASLFFHEASEINELLASLELPPCDEGQLLLKRSLSREKAPRMSVNGGLASLSALQKLGESWIDFHGPSEPRRLLKDSCQLELLDLFGKTEKALNAYRAEYEAWRAALAERDRVARETKLSGDQIQFLQTQISQLENLELTEEAIETLERDFHRQSRAQELQQLAAGLGQALIGEEGATRTVSSLVKEARHLESLDASSKALADRLASVAVELQDLGQEFENLTAEFQFDPEQAELVQQKMNTWLDARRRHGSDVKAVQQALEEMRRRLEIQGDIEGTLARLEQAIAKSEKALRKEGATLRAEREKAARDLTKIAAKSIALLGFKKADFQIRITSLPEPGPTGDSSCEFLFSANVGEAPLPLSRIASSGELARVMLALKTVLADLDAVPVLVFDEVDANVGGEIGRVVGEKMAEIAKRHQVLCVTHLPQVAALGSAHFVVTKDQTGDRASVSISSLHEKRKARLSELARMLGDRNAKSALAHAEDLLGDR